MTKLFYGLTNLFAGHSESISHKISFVKKGMAFAVSNLV